MDSPDGIDPSALGKGAIAIAFLFAILGVIGFGLTHHWNLFMALGSWGSGNAALLAAVMAGLLLLFIALSLYSKPKDKALPASLTAKGRRATGGSGLVMTGILILFYQWRDNAYTASAGAAAPLFAQMQYVVSFVAIGFVVIGLAVLYGQRKGR